MIQRLAILHHWLRRSAPAMLACHAGLLAQQARAAELGGFLAASSDNVYRGLTQSTGDPSLSGDLHWRADTGWFAGLTLSTVNLNPGPSAPLEIAAYAGLGRSLSTSLRGTLSAVHYEYPSDPRVVGYAYDELQASLSWRDRAAVNLAYSPNTSRFSYAVIAVHRPAWSTEIVVSQPLKAHWDLRAGVGRYAMAAPIDASYWYWNITLAHAYGPWQFELAAIGTDATARALFGNSVAGNRAVLSVIRRFSAGGTP